MIRFVPRLRSTSYANVASTVAIVLALGGTSYAAVVLQDGQVKTRHIADGAVTSLKLHNPAVAVVDLKPAAKQRVWSSRHNFPGGGGDALTSSFHVYHTLNVPAGKYLVSGFMEATNNSGVVNGPICDVTRTGGVGDRFVAIMANGETGTVGGQQILTLSSPGQIKMTCLTNVASSPVNRRNSSLTALKVHTNTNSAPTP